MIVLYFILLLTNLELFKDCALNCDLDCITNCEVLDQFIKKCEISTCARFDSWKISSVACRLHVDDTMPLQVNDQVLDQDLKVM